MLDRPESLVPTVDRRLRYGAENVFGPAVARVLQWCHERADVALNHVADSTARLAEITSLALRRFHTGKLRLNLRWVIVALLLISIALAAWPLS